MIKRSAEVRSDRVVMVKSVVMNEDELRQTCDMAMT